MRNLILIICILGCFFLILDLKLFRNHQLDGGAITKKSSSKIDSYSNQSKSPPSRYLKSFGLAVTADMATVGEKVLQHYDVTGVPPSVVESWRHAPIKQERDCNSPLQEPRSTQILALLRSKEHEQNPRLNKGLREGLAICAVAFDELEYLLEWVLFHKLVGAKRIYVYQDLTDDTTTQSHALRQVIAEKFVHIRRVPRENLVHSSSATPAISEDEIFADCLKEVMVNTNFKWVAMLGTGEYIYPRPDRTPGSAPESRVLRQYPAIAKGVSEEFYTEQPRPFVHETLEKHYPNSCFVSVHRYQFDSMGHIRRPLNEEDSTKTTTLLSYPVRLKRELSHTKAVLNAEQFEKLFSFPSKGPNAYPNVSSRGDHVRDWKQIVEEIRRESTQSLLDWEWTGSRWQRVVERNGCSCVTDGEGKGIETAPAWFSGNSKLSVNKYARSFEDILDAANAIPKMTKVLDAIDDHSGSYSETKVSTKRKDMTNSLKRLLKLRMVDTVMEVQANPEVEGKEPTYDEEIMIYDCALKKALNPEGFSGK